MVYEPKNFDHLIGKVAGLSEAQLKAHFGLYQGYVKKLNEIWEKLGKTEKAAPNYSFNEYSELRRREPVANNGTVLHELYFENLVKQGQPADDLSKAIADSFGSMDNWIADTKACLGSAHGWTLTVWDEHFRKVRNVLVRTEHDVGLMPSQQILVAIDAWEHAYMIDYGTKKPEYITSVMNALNWDKINERWKNARR